MLLSLRDCRVATPARPEPVTRPVKCRLPDRLERLPDRLTHHPIDHVRDPQPALPATRLRDHRPTDHARPIVPRQQLGRPASDQRSATAHAVPRPSARPGRVPLVLHHLRQSHPSTDTATSSIVTGVPCSTLTIAFGTTASSLGSVPNSDPGPLAGFLLSRSAGQAATTVSSTGTAFPCPPAHLAAERALPRRPVLRGPPTSAGPSSRRPLVLRPTGQPAAGTQQISRDKTQRFRRDHVANTPSGPTGTGHRCREPAHPPEGTPYGASLSFATTTHLWLPSDTPSRKPPQRHTQPHWGPPGQLRAVPLPHQCWVPPVRAPGQDFHLRSPTSCPAYPLAYGSLRTAARLTISYQSKNPRPLHPTLRQPGHRGVLHWWSGSAHRARPEPDRLLGDRGRRPGRLHPRGDRRWTARTGRSQHRLRAGDRRRTGLCRKRAKRPN